MKLTRILGYLSLCLCAATLTMCEKKPTPPAEANDSKPEKSPEQIAAEKAVEENPNVKLLRVEGDKMSIENVHTGLGMTLTFQQVIERDYVAIDLDEAAAAKILKPRKSAKLSQKKHDETDWGQTPEWIPRLDGIKISPNKMHGPRENGMVWGQFRATHEKADLKTLRDHFVEGMKAKGLKLAYETASDTSVQLAFRAQKSQGDEKPLLRTSSILIGSKDGVAFLTVQYNYNY